MAVEASHITHVPQPNREMIYQGNGGRFDNRLDQTAFGSISKMDLKAESGLTSNHPLSRKRSLDVSSFNPPLISIPDAPINVDEFAFLREDISSQMYQQQLEIDRFIAHHTEKMRAATEEMRMRNSRRLIAAAQEGIMKRLKTKDEEIAKIGQLNWSLEEKVKSLIVENQIWKELAQTNEATANALRNNLQQVLAQVQLQHQHQHRLDFAENVPNTTTFVADDTQSYCGSNYEEDQLAEDGVMNLNRKNEYGSTTGRYGGWCRNCGKEESCVLLLPCRHLCVCSVCVFSVSICPVCKSKKSAGVHVNMS